MKILFINSVCKSGSTGKIVYDLYTQVRANGDDAAICYGRGDLVTGENIYRFAPKLGVYFHAFMTRLTGWTGCFSPIGTKNLIRFIESYKPDVIHIHELHAYFVNLSPLLKLIAAKNIKVIWTFHCEFMYTGKCGHANDCENWKTSCGNCPQLRDYPKTMFFDFTKPMFLQKKEQMRKINDLTIVTPSAWLASRVKESFLKDRDIQVIWNGIDTEHVFYPQPYEHLKELHGITTEKIVLAVAPDLMRQQKGGRYVVQLADKMKNENVKFILIGVSKLSEKFSSNVIALGRTENQTELAAYYSMADVFVICSEKENFPTTCLEALACGTPVCGFDVGGTKETAPDGMGIFVEFGNIPMLEQAVRAVLAQANVSQRCSLYASQHYCASSMFQSYLRLYREPV